jgi:hypothetical protein
MHAHPFHSCLKALICYGGHGHGTKDAHTDTFQISRFTHKGLQEARHPTGRPPSALSRKASKGLLSTSLLLVSAALGTLGHGRVTSNFKGLTASLQEPAL